MAQNKEMKFEESLQKLEDIVDRLEAGDLSLTEALKVYEEGVQLSQACAKRLEDVQQKIEVLMRNSSGELVAAEADDDLKPKKKKKA